MTTECSGQGSSHVDIMSHVSQHSLVVVRTKHLHWLGLRSLREVSAGKVMLKDNPQLCYTQPFQWKRLFRSTEQIATIHNNKPVDICGRFVFESASCLTIIQWCYQKTQLCCWYRAAKPDVWLRVHRPGLLGSRSWHVRVLSPLQSQGSLCSILQLAAWVRTAIYSIFHCVRGLAWNWADMFEPVCVCVICSEPREVEMNGSCVVCHSECQLQTGIPTCHGPVGSVFH